MNYTKLDQKNLNKAKVDCQNLDTTNPNGAHLNRHICCNLFGVLYRQFLKMYTVKYKSVRSGALLIKQALVVYNPFSLGGI